MKKVISLLVAMVMLMGVTVFTATLAGAEGESQGIPLIYETFEAENALENVGKTAGSGASATFSIADGGYNGSDKSLHFLQETGGYVNVRFDLGGLPLSGKKTHFSMKIKINTEIAAGANTFSLIFYGSGKVTYQHVSPNYTVGTEVSNAFGIKSYDNYLVANEWVEFDVDISNLRLQTSCGALLEDDLIINQIDIRVGDTRGKNVDAAGVKLDYQLDDVVIKDMGPSDTTIERPTVSNVTFQKVDEDGLKVDYTYNPVGTETEARDKSLIRAYVDTDNGERNIGTFRPSETFRVPPSAAGKTVKVEVIPVSSTGVLGESVTQDSTVRFDLLGSLKLNESKTKATWSLSAAAPEGTGSYPACVSVATYSKDNALVSLSYQTYTIQESISTYSGEFNIPASADKVKFFVWNATSLKPLMDAAEENLFTTNNNPFAGDDEINIVFVGDSIYANAGAGGEENGFVYQVGEWIKETYAQPGKTINWYNTSFGGTTTDYTFVRFQKDVLSKNPDMIFFSMTCNDGSDSDTLRNVESCIRMVNELDDKPCMALTFFTNRNWRTSPGYGEQLAAYYNIPLFNNTEAMQAKVASGTPVADLYIADGVHPSPAGYTVIADALKDWLGTNRHFVQPTDRTEKLDADSGTIDTMDVFSSTNEVKVTRSGSWAANGNYLESTAVGDTLEFDFTGDILAFETALHQHSGMIEVYVDDVLSWTNDSYYNFGNDTTFQLAFREGNFNFDLPYGEHHVVLKVVAGQDTTADNIKTRVYNIFAGSWE